MVTNFSDRLTRKTRQLLGSDKHKFEALLGNGTGYIDVPGRTGMRYVRRIDGNYISTPIIVRSGGSYPPSENVRVTVALDDEGQLAIQGVIFSSFVAQGGDPGTLNAGDDRDKSVKSRMITPLLCTAVSTANTLSTEIAIQPFIYEYPDGTLNAFYGGNVDLTTVSSPPSAGNHCVVVVCLNIGTSTISLTKSTPKDVGIPLDFADIVEAVGVKTAGTLPVWAWRLIGDTSNITAADDIEDLRTLWNLPGSFYTLSITEGNGIEATEDAPNDWTIGIADGGVGSTQLADNAVTNAKLADNAVNTAEIVNAAVDSTKLANNAVETNKINNLAVTSGKLADGAVVVGKIADNAVSNAKMADNSVGTAELIDLNVTTAKIADNAITATQLATNAVSTNKIADSAVSDAKINSVDAAKITTGTLALARGGTGADLSATGGANQFLRQSSAGGVVTVSALADADIPDTITLSNITQITTRSHTSLSDIGTNTHAQIDTHISATAAHGATGAVVGTTNSQTLTSKTIDAAVYSGNGTGVFNLDNLRLDGNTISSTNTNGEIRVIPDGSGNIRAQAASVSVAANNDVGFTYYPSNTSLHLARSGNPALLLGTPVTGNVAHFYRNQVQIGWIDVTSLACTYNSISDRRLKQAITAASTREAIEKLMAIKVRNFRFKHEPSMPAIGFIADELQAVAPEAVTGEKDAVRLIGNVKDAQGKIIAEGETCPPDFKKEGQIFKGKGRDKQGAEIDLTWEQTGQQDAYQGVDASKLVPTLVLALQDALKRIEALEAKSA